MHTMFKSNGISNFWKSNYNKFLNCTYYFFIIQQPIVHCVFNSSYTTNISSKKDIINYLQKKNSLYFILFLNKTYVKYTIVRIKSENNIINWF